MNIPLKTNKSRFHREILELIRSLPPLDKLRNKELELLAEIMRQYQECSDVPKDKRKYIIFATENRNKIGEDLKISKGNMNTYLVKIRKYKLLSKYNDLNPILDIPFGDFDINIKFKITE